MKRFLAAITLLSIGCRPVLAADIVAQSLPVLSEPSWAFTDQGKTYLVGKESGKVTILRSNEVEPEKPRPKPPPPVPDQVAGVKWFSVIVDPSNAEQAAWRTNSELRNELDKRKIEFRTYLSTETDIDTLGFRQTVTTTGTPCVILQDGSGKLIKTVAPKTLDDLIKIMEVIK